jgi:hypothetical protein
MTPSITQDAINVALGNFLTSILPAGTTIIVGQVNRVAEPEGDFVVMWPLRRPRLSTNLDTSNDCKFTGSIALTVMTVTAVQLGTITPTNTVFGVGVAANTTIVNQLTGPTGGAGTYTIAPSQTVASETLSAGAIEVAQDTEVVMQIDVHGPSSTDNAQTIATLFRDDYAVTEFESEPIAITPLYAEDPRQMPFVNAANQYEDRWTIDLHLEIAPVVSVPQEFADAVDLTVVDVEVTYPPQ